MSSYSELRHLIRRELRDDSAHRYTDSILDGLIDSAQSEYAQDTAKLTGTFDCVSGDNGRVQLPEDFLYPMRLLDSHGNEIPFLSWRTLHEEYGANFINQVGLTASCVCFNYLSYGTLFVYPILKKGTRVGTLTYARLPKKGVIEFSETEPLVAWVRFYVSMIESRADANTQYKLYLDSVQRNVGRYASTRNKSGRRGKFF